MITPPRPLRAALIGCGRIAIGHPDDHPALQAASHAAAYQACPDSELVAVCDARAEVAAAAGARLGVPAFSDYRSLLAAVQPEVVSLCTPDDTHAAILAEVLLSPGLRGVLAEKPLALEVAAASQLVATAAQRGVVLAVNYSRRYAPSQQALARRLAAGALGRINSVSGCYSKGIRHNGTHWFDWLRLLLGAAADGPAEVMAYPGGEDFGDDPSPQLMIHFASGLVAQLQAANHSAYSLFEIALSGDAGRLRIDQSGHRACWQPVIDSPLYAGYRTLADGSPEDTLMSNLLLHAVADLLAAIRDARPPACSGADALAALRLADAACRSLASGRPVRC